METQTLDRLVRLGAGDLMRVDARPGQHVAVFDGKVWITQLGDSADHVIGTGESFAYDRRGLALVEALEPTRLAVLASPATSIEVIGYEAAWPLDDPRFDAPRLGEPHVVERQPLRAQAA